MNSNASTSRAETTALARFAFISKIQELLRTPVPLQTALVTVAASAVLERDGQSRPVPRRTLEDWWYAYQRGGFAALHPKARSDRGVPRVLTPDQERHILEQVKAHPAIAVKVLYRQWKEADPKLPALSAVYRALQRQALDQRSRRYLVRQALSGPTKAFEAPWVNELWMTDFSPGPFLQVPGQRAALATHLCAIIDDHSRVVPHAAYYLAADTRSFHESLKQALRRRGLPRKLYTDQGGPFTNDHTRVICANLGIRLLHAKPYHAWSKGKVERVIFTIQQDFEAGLRLPGQGAGSLVELNTQFSLWLQSVYHTRVHSSTGMTPAERYQRGAHLVKALDPHLDLDQLFYHQLTRTVRRDGTVRLGNQLYEVDLSLRTLTVQLRFDPFKLDRIEVTYRATAFGLAKPVNAQLNSQIQGGDAYEKRA